MKTTFKNIVACTAFYYQEKDRAPKHPSEFFLKSLCDVTVEFYKATDSSYTGVFTSHLTGPYS